MFDTNTVSDIVWRDETVLRYVERFDPRQCCVSAVTAVEVAYGLARCSDATWLHRLTQVVMDCLDVLPWNAETAHHYARSGTAGPVYGGAGYDDRGPCSDL